MTSNINSTINKLNSELTHNLANYDSDLLEKLLQETISRLDECKKIDNEILNVLKDKTNFKTGNSMNEFIKSFVGKSSNKTKRIDAELENTRILTSKSISNSILMDEIAKIKKKEEESSDMSNIWMKMDIETLKREFKKYDTVTSLKKAAGKILKSNDKKSTSRTKIETAIINRIQELKATVNIGK